MKFQVLEVDVTVATIYWRIAKQSDALKDLVTVPEKG